MGDVRNTPSRCIHQGRGVCPACAAFAKSLAVAVKGVHGANTLWRPGILADLSRAAKGTR